MCKGMEGGSSVTSVVEMEDSILDEAAEGAESDDKGLFTGESQE